MEKTPPKFLIIRDPKDRKRRRLLLKELKKNSSIINSIIDNFEEGINTKDESTKILSDTVRKMADAGRFVFAVPNLEYFNQLKVD